MYGDMKTPYGEQIETNPDPCGPQEATFDEPKRESLRDNVKSRLRRAKKESAKLDRLIELDKLLHENPVTARILELMREFDRY